MHRELMKLAADLRGPGDRSLADLPANELASAYANVLSEARNKGFNGFGGACGTAAVAINRVLFGGKGVILGAFNDFFLELGYHIGHIAVEFNGAVWDADGRAKPSDQLESWGMLDFEDSDYQERAEGLGGEWTEEAAESVGVFELTDDEALVAMERHDLSRMVATLKQALFKLYPPG